MSHSNVSGETIPSLTQIFFGRLANFWRRRRAQRAAPGRRLQFQAIEPRILLSADLIFNAPINLADDSFTLRLDSGSGDLELLNGETVVASQALAETSGVLINGEDGRDDSLKIDFTHGGFFSLDGGITFNGGADGFDALEIQGGAFTVVTHTVTATGPGLSGNIVYEDGLNPALRINYTGLEPVDMTGSTVADLVFNLPGTDDQAILEDDGIAGNGISQLRSQNGTPTFDLTTFSNPTGSLTVNMGGDNGLFTVASLPDFTAALTINGQAGSDNVTFTGATNLSSAGADLAITVGGSITDTAGTSLQVNDLATFNAGAGGITLGESGGDTTNFGTLTFNSTGAISIAEDSSMVLTGNNVGGSGAVDLFASGAVTFNGNIVTSGGAVTLFNGVPVVLGSPATVMIDTTNGGTVAAGRSIVISGTVNDDGTPTSLVLRAGTQGTINLQGVVGGTTAIQGLSIESANAVRLQAVQTREGGISVTTAGSSPMTRLLGNLSTTHGAAGAGHVTLVGPVELLNNIEITTDHASGADGNVSIAGAVDGDAPGRSLSLSAGGGDVTFGGAVGGVTPLQSLNIGSANDVTLQAVNTREGGLTVTTAVAGDANSITLSGNIDTTQGVSAGNVSLIGPVTLAASINAGAISATESVTVSGVRTIGAAAFNAASLVIGTGASLALNATSTLGALSLSGTLTGTGTSTLTGPGNSSWTGGAYTSTGELVVGSGHTLTIGGPAEKDFGTGTLRNQGTVLWTDGNIEVVGGATNASNAGTVVNSGLFDIQGANDFGDRSVGLGILTFNNEAGATLLKSGAGLTSIGSAGGVTPNGVNFNNAGTVEVQAGALSINNRFSITSILPVGTGTSSGTFSVAAGTALHLGGNNTLTGSSVVSGAGTVFLEHGTFSTVGTWSHTGALAIHGGTATFAPAVTPSAVTVETVPGGPTTILATFDAPVTTGPLTISEGTAIFNAATTATSLELSGTGTLRGTGIVTLAGAGDSSWTGGAYTGPGQLLVTSGHTLTIGGATEKDFGSGTLVNDGTVLWTGGNIDVVGSGAVLNRGLFDVQVSGGNFGDQSVGGGTLTFNNELGATLRKSGPGLTAIGSRGGGTPNPVNLNNAGTLEVQTGTLSINHSFDGVPIAGGSLANSGTILVLAGATLQRTGGFTSAGLVAGGGTINVGAGNTFINTGTVAPGVTSDPTDTLSITGNYAQGTNGILDIDVAGTGTGNFDALAITGGATIAGPTNPSTLSVELLAGFAPQPGNQFRFMTFASLSGSFQTTILPPHLAVQSAVGALDLVFVNAAPVAIDDSFVTDEDTPLMISAADLAADDTDADGDLLTVTAVQGGVDTHGTVALVGGVVTYVPDADFNGVASFSYTVEDEFGATDTGLVIIAVNAVNDGFVSNVNYDASTDTLTFESQGDAANAATVTSPSANRLRIVVGSGETIVLSGDTSVGFLLSADGTQLDIDTSLAAISLFGIDLAGGDDTLFLTNDADNGLGSLTADGGEGSDSVTLNTISLGGSLSVTAELITINGGLITTGSLTGDQSYSGAVILDSDTTLNGNDISFAGTLNSDTPVTPRALAVNSANNGTTTFGGTVGASSALASVTTNADGVTALNGGLITTTGDQTFNDVVVLGADTTLSGNDISFGQTINSDGTPRDLTVNSNNNGATTFGGAVGATSALASLTTNADGGTALNGGLITTTGDQTFNDVVVLGADTILSGNDIFFNQTVDSDFIPRALTVNSNSNGVTAFGGTVGGSQVLGNLTVNSGTVSVSAEVFSGPQSIIAAGDVTVVASTSSAGLTAIGTQTITAGGGFIVRSGAGGNAQITAMDGQTIDARFVEVTALGGAALIQNNASGAQLVSTHGTNAVGQGLSLSSLFGGSAIISQNVAGGTQEITVTNADRVTLDTPGGGVASILTALNGTQTLSITGAGANALVLGGPGSLGISQIVSAFQTIVAGSTEEEEAGSITIFGRAAGSGGANSFIVSQQVAGGTQTVSTPGALTVIGGTAPTGAVAGIFANGTNGTGSQQTINAGSIFLQGGDGGSGNGAQIAANSGSQLVIVGAGGISLTGGTGGTNNQAAIREGVSGVPSVGQTQTVTVIGGGINLQGGSGTGNGVFIAGTDQDISATGSVTLNSSVSNGNSAASIGSVSSKPTNLELRAGGDVVLTGGAANSAAFIGSAGTIPGQPNNITIDADGSVILNVGAGSGARIGSSTAAAAAAGDISISAGGDIQLNGTTTQVARIRTLGNVTLDADGSISETSNSLIEANALTTTSDGGTNLIGPNQVAVFNATNTTSGNVTLVDAGGLTVTGISNPVGDISVSTTGQMTVTGSLHSGTHDMSLTAPGGVFFTADAVLNIDLGGIATDQFTTVTISGNVTLGGTLDVEEVNGFAPTSGDRFRFMTFASRAGFFDVINQPTQFYYIDDSDATDLELVFDDTSPTVTINQASGQPDPTNASPIRFTVLFSEAVLGFDAGDISFAGSTLTNLTASVTGSGANYTVSVTGMNGVGRVVASVVDDAVFDIANNFSDASTSTDNMVTFDNVAPTARLNQASGQVDPTNASPILFTVLFSEVITGFTGADISFAGSTVGGTLTASVSGTGTTYTVSVTGMNGVGLVRAAVVANAAMDLAGNFSAASNSVDNTVTFDNVAPTVTIDQALGQEDPTNDSPISFTVFFSEAVLGFDASDISFAGSTLSNLVANVTGSGTSYTVTVTGMDGVGTVQASIGANAATDVAGNGNFASTSTDNMVTFDNVAPTVTIDQALGQEDPTNDSPISFTVFFSEAVLGFDASDISFAGSTLSNLVANVTGSGTSYTVTVTGMDGVGTVQASIGANAATDVAGNGNFASTSTDNMVTFDNVAPTVTIDQALGQEDPTNDSPISFTVFFSEAVLGFDASDISFAGSTLSNLVANVTGSGTSYTVTVTGMDGVGTVQASIGANAATDVAGNGNFASTSTDNMVTFDNVAPTVTIDQALGQEDPTNDSPISFTVFFSEAVLGFDASDISFAGSTLSNLVANVTGSGTSYTVTVTGMDGVGTVQASIGANAATDVAGNGNFASTSTDNMVTFDNVAPTVTIDQALGQEDPTNDSPISFTVFFSEAVLGFDASDISFAGSTLSNLVANVTGSGTSYTVTVTGMDGVGTVQASIGANAATDVAGNGNFASTSTDNMVTFDNVAPTVTIDQALGQEDPTNDSPISFTVFFSEAVLGFDASDISFAGSTVGGTLTAMVTGSGASYTVSVAGMTSSGTVVASVEDDAATDLAGNLSDASTSTDNTVTFEAAAGGIDLVGAVTWDPDDLLIPGDHEHVTVVVFNNGDTAVHQQVKVKLYASVDQELNAGDIFLDQRLTGSDIEPGSSSTAQFNLVFPSNLLPGTYFLLAEVDPANQVPESDEENNTASGGSFDFHWMFGQVPGHGWETLTVREADGTWVNFSLLGPGTGEVTIDGEGKWDLLVTGTTGSSILSILTLGGGDLRVEIDDIHVTGALRGILAPKMDLTGTLAIDGALGAGMMIGSATDAVIAVETILGRCLSGLSVQGIAILGDLEDSEILIGADLGADGQLGGSGANADTYSDGDLGNLLITGSMISSGVRVGQDPGADGIFDTGDDVLLDGSIDSITVRGEMTDDSFFVADDLPRYALIDGRKVYIATDPRFVDSLPESGGAGDPECGIDWSANAGSGWGAGYSPFGSSGQSNFSDFLVRLFR